MKKTLLIRSLMVTGVLFGGLLTYGGYKLMAEKSERIATVTPAQFKKTYTKELDELDHLIKRYSGDLFLSGTVSYFEESAGKMALAERENFTSIAVGAASFFALDSVVTLSVENINITVDHRERIIIVQETPERQEIPATGNNPLPLEELAQYIEDVSNKTEGNAKVLTLRLTPDAPGNYHVCEIYYSPIDYKLIKIIYSGMDQEFVESNQVDSADLKAYGEVMLDDSIETGYLNKSRDMRVEMVYKTERKPRKEEVDVHKYVVKNGDEYVATRAYQHYMIHN